MKAITGMPPRKLYKFACVCLLLWLVFGLFGNFVSQTNANPDWATETSSDITIENSYYKVVIKKATPYCGGIYNFYLKPYETVDVSASSGDYTIMGIHEFQDKDNSSCFQFQGDVGKNYPTSTTILKQTSEYVVVYSTMNLTEGGKWMYVEEWKTFYMNERYILVNFERTYDEFDDIDQNQVCWLFDINWVDGMTFLNETGQVKTIDYTKGGGSSLHVFNAFVAQTRVNQTYPWLLHYNSTYGLGLGIVSLSASHPLWFEHWWDLREAVANNYIEPQLTFKGRVYIPENTKEHASYFYYVTSDSHTAIKNFAQSLWVSTKTTEAETYWTYASSSISDNYEGSIPQVMQSVSYPFYVYIKTGSQDLSDAGLRLQFLLKNSTHTWWQAWDQTNENQYYSYRNSTYACWKWTSTWNNRMVVNASFETWHDSDIVRFISTYKALTQVKLSKIKTDIGVTQAHWNNTHVIYDNGTKYDYYYGFLVHNTTAMAPNIPNYGYYGHLYYNASGDRTFASGTTWTCTWWIQPIRKKTSEGCIDTSDFFTSIHNTNLAYFDNYWVNLYDASGMRVKDFISDNTNLLYHNYADEKLTLLIYGRSGTTSTTKVYVGDKGNPATVSGATSWSYDSNTKICTITVTHSSSQEVVLDWTVKIPGDVNGDGVVDASDLFDLIKAYGSEPGYPNWNPECDFNIDNKVDALDLFNLSKNYGKTLP